MITDKAIEGVGADYIGLAMVAWIRALPEGAVVFYSGSEFRHPFIIMGDSHVGHLFGYGRNDTHVNDAIERMDEWMVDQEWETTLFPGDYFVVAMLPPSDTSAVFFKLKFSDDFLG